MKAEDYINDTIKNLKSHLEEKETAAVCNEVQSVARMKRNMKKFEMSLSKAEEKAQDCKADYQFRFNRPGFEADLQQLFKKNIKFIITTKQPS